MEFSEGKKSFLIITVTYTRTYSEDSEKRTVSMTFIITCSTDTYIAFTSLFFQFGERRCFCFVIFSPSFIKWLLFVLGSQLSEIFFSLYADKRCLMALNDLQQTRNLSPNEFMIKIIHHNHKTSLTSCTYIQCNMHKCLVSFML